MFIFLFKYEGGTKVCVHRVYSDTVYIVILYSDAIYSDTVYNTI